MNEIGTVNRPGGDTRDALRARRHPLVVLVALVAMVAGSLALTASPAAASSGTVKLVVDAAHQLVNGTATLRANASGGGIRQIQIYDVSSGQRVPGAACPLTASSCAGQVSYGYETSHTYMAYVAGSSSTAPPPSIESHSNQVTVSWRPGLVLNTNQTEVDVHHPATLVASSATAVGSTCTQPCAVTFPRFIAIYDQATGVRVCFAASGTTCQVSVTSSTVSTHTYVAYVALATLTNTTSGPPPNITAESNTVKVSWNLPT